ncbi:hypothetical protein DIPPA_08393 [Diplonema papillatum]|nr:hypothetical protein DIPPA_08393 [Diplonema papillatum]|eukprot:gene4181-6486_t
MQTIVTRNLNGEETVVRKCCAHNEWENVRVLKGSMTLRCRVCQKQWRAKTEVIWRVLRCPDFLSARRCDKGSDCKQLHIHYRKQSLVDRVEQHGEHVLARIKNLCTAAVQQEVAAYVAAALVAVLKAQCTPHGHWQALVREMTGSVAQKVATHQLPLALPATAGGLVPLPAPVNTWYVADPHAAAPMQKQPIYYAAAAAPCTSPVALASPVVMNHPHPHPAFQPAKCNFVTAYEPLPQPQAPHAYYAVAAAPPSLNAMYAVPIDALGPQTFIFIQAPS